jgi:hypothetical protein
LIQILFVILFILSATLSQAQTSEAICQKVGLMAKFGPVRSQGNMGWCYANAAADLLSYHYRVELNNKPVSAAYVALKFNYSWWAENFREGGLMYFAMQDAMKNGLCPRYFDDDLMSRGNKSTLKEKLEFILNLKDMLDAGKIEEVKEAIRESYKYKSILAQIPIYDLLTLMAISSRDNVLGRLADFICAEKRHQVKTIARREFSTKYTLSTRSDLIEEINENLSKENPVGVAYFADFFDAENAPKTESSRHMSVIVDREFNKTTQMCEYWIRNSWGAKCTGYKNPKMKARCKEGNVLVPENILHEYIYAISYLKD